MYLTKEVTDEEVSERLQKWISIFTTPVNKESTKAVISNLYSRAGYLTPKIIFLDSPFAVILSAEEHIRLLKYRPQSVSKKLLCVKEGFIRSLLKQLLCDYSQLVDHPLIN